MQKICTFESVSRYDQDVASSLTQLSPELRQMKQERNGTVPMTTPEPSRLPENGYVLDPESATEMARLLLQDRLINEMVGGLFPERENLDGIERILDIGCGPGGWALDLARSYPQKEITGIDISQQMLTYANEQKK